MVAESYRPPIRADKEHAKKHTHSQSLDTNLASETSTVAHILEQKDGGVVTVDPQATVKTAVTILKEKRIGALLVVDGDGVMQGILSERDIVRKLAETPGQTLPQLVEGLMTRKVVTCSAADSLESVMKQMNAGRFRHMPVMDHGELRGMISIGDVVNYRLLELEYESLKMKQMIVG